MFGVVRLFPSRYPFSFLIGEQVFVWLKSDKETGRAVIIELPQILSDNDNKNEKPETPDESKTNLKRYKVQYFSDNSTCHVRPARILKIFETIPQKNTLIICDNTDDFRRLARSQLSSIDKVVDIGCSYGVGTSIMATHCASVIGLDISEECITSARKEYPHIQFENFDILQYKQRLSEIILNCNKVFIDIGGNREMSALTEIIPFISLHQNVSLIVVKSRALFKSAQLFKDEDKTNKSDILLNHEVWWSKLNIETKKRANEIEENEKNKLKKQIKPYHSINLNNNNNNNDNNENENETRNEECNLLFTRYPLRYPPKFTPDGVPICRYHNYGVCVASQYDKQCNYDHEYCHYCGIKGHIAKNCPTASLLPTNPTN